MSELLNGILGIAREAGTIMLEGSEKIKEMKIKNKSGHGNYVTEYDSKIQEYLVKELSGLLPEANFVGEENGQEVFKDEYRSGFTFVLDPIDGTANFVKGWNESVISIGLLKDCRPYIGVVFNPYMDWMFSAQKGEGAFLNDHPISTSEEPLNNSIVIMGTSPYYPDLTDKSFLIGREAVRYGIDIRRGGSAEQELCRVAAGQGGMFFELCLSLWDYAAGSAILLEAGGSITNIKGEPLTYDGPSSILALSAGISDEEMQWLKAFH